MKRYQAIREEQLRAGQEADRLLRSGAPFLLFGTTTYAVRIARAAAVVGHSPVAFIDDRRAGERFENCPVIALKDADPKLPVISGVVEGRPKTVHHLLHNAGFTRIWNYYHLNLVEPDAFPVPFWTNNVPDIDLNGPRYDELRAGLADEESRSTLDALLHFRYTNDYLSGGLRYHLHDQYWESFVPMERIRSFVDGGCFDGQTALQFISRQPAYTRVDVFEPFPESMANVQRNLADRPNVHAHPFAILNERKTLRFTTDAGSANGLSEQGDIQVNTCSIDEELVGVQVDYLKLDIEGAEPEAVDGAARLISEQRPVMAICVYHDQSHFWRIPEKVLALRSDYQVYLRHYSEGVYETVMYFI